MNAQKVISTAAGWRKWCATPGNEAALLMLRPGMADLKAEKRDDRPIRFLHAPTIGARFTAVTGFPTAWNQMPAAYDALLRNQAEKQKRAAARAAKAAKADVLTIGQLRDKWLTRHTQERQYRALWDKWLSAIDGKPATELLRSQRAAMTQAIDNGCPPASAARLCSIFGTLYRWAGKTLEPELEIPGIPLKLKDISEQKSRHQGSSHRDTVIEVAELQRLWRELPDTTVGRLVRWLVLTGCRKSEARLLTWGMIHFEPTEAYPQGRVVLPGLLMKMDKDHAFPLSDMMKEVLSRCPGWTMDAEKRADLLVFPAYVAGEPTHRQPISMNAANELLLALNVQAAHIEADYLPTAIASPHDIRRSLATHAVVEAGIDWVTANRMLAHKMKLPGAAANYIINARQVSAQVREAWATMQAWHRETLNG